MFLNRWMNKEYVTKGAFSERKKNHCDINEKLMKLEIDNYLK